MLTNLFALTVVTFTLLACGTEPETAVAFYPVQLDEADTQPEQVAAAYSITTICRGDNHTALHCYSKNQELIGTLTLGERLRVDEALPIAEPPEPAEHLEDKLIEVACRLCALYQGAASTACTVCQSDDEPGPFDPLETM